MRTHKSHRGGGGKASPSLLLLREEQSGTGGRRCNDDTDFQTAVATGEDAATAAARRPVHPNLLELMAYAGSEAASLAKILTEALAANRDPWSTARNRKIKNHSPINRPPTFAPPLPRYKRGGGDEERGKCQLDKQDRGTACSWVGSALNRQLHATYLDSPDTLCQDHSAAFARQVSDIQRPRLSHQPRALKSPRFPDQNPMQNVRLDLRLGRVSTETRGLTGPPNGICG